MERCSDHTAPGTLEDADGTPLLDAVAPPATPFSTAPKPLDLVRHLDPVSSPMGTLSTSALMPGIPMVAATPSVLAMPLGTAVPSVPSVPAEELD